MLTDKHQPHRQAQDMEAHLSVRRFVPVPHEALELISQNDWGAVTDLYKRGHALRWRRFEVTIRSLTTRWGVSRRRAWTILEELQSLGFLSVVRGSGGLPSTVEVFDPTQKSGPVVGPVVGPKPAQVSPTPATDGAGSGPRVGPVVGPMVGPHLVRPELNLNLNSEEAVPTEGQIKKRAEQGTLSAKAKTVYDAWKTQKNPDGTPAHPESRCFRKSDQGPVKQRIKEYGVEAVVRVVEWAHQCPGSWWYQKQAWGLDTLTRAKGFGDKVKQANEWTPGSGGAAGDWPKVLELATMPTHQAREAMPGTGYRERSIRSAAGELSKMNDHQKRAQLPHVKALFERRIAAGRFDV